MIGAIIGDVVGSRFEADNHKSKDFELFTKDCSVTDDSIMTIAVAKTIIETERVKSYPIVNYSPDSDYFKLLDNMAIKYMQKLGQEYPNCGFGGMFRKWVLSENPQPYNSFGNGAAMRISPVAFVARTQDELFKLSEIITATTHNHKEGIKGAEATALAIFMARIGNTKAEIREKINSDYYPLDFTIDEIRDTYRFDVTCQGSVPQAIVAFLESTSFEDAVRTAISIGGDSDTIAAISGSIAEAYYGVPKAMKNQALLYLDNSLREIYDEWEQIIGDKDNNKYKLLTKYIGKFEFVKSFGDWHVDHINEGIQENPIQMPHVNYTKLADMFVEEFYQFVEAHPEYSLSNYKGILEKNNIKWDSESMRNVDLNSIDSDCILALVMGAIRADRFSEGTLLGFFEEGYILDWLKRLRVMDSGDLSRDIEDIYLELSGYGILDKYHINFSQDKARMTTLEWQKNTIETVLNIEESNDFINNFRNINVECWNSQYIEPYIFDGEQWELVVKYQGLREKVWMGNNYYPPNWRELLRLFRIDLNEEIEDEKWVARDD